MKNNQGSVFSLSICWYPSYRKIRIDKIEYQRYTPYGIFSDWEKFRSWLRSHGFDYKAIEKLISDIKTETWPLTTFFISK